MGLVYFLLVWEMQDQIISKADTILIYLPSLCKRVNEGMQYYLIWKYFNWLQHWQAEVLWFLWQVLEKED